MRQTKIFWRVLAGLLFISALHAGDTPQSLYGPLYLAVQKANLFEDSKEFADAIPKKSPAAIMADYRKERPQSPAALKAFVAAHFDLAEPAAVLAGKSDSRPLQWIAVAGLRRYDNILAKTISCRWIVNVNNVYRRSGKLVEKYDVVDLNRPGGGGEYKLQDGFGWSNGVTRKLLSLYPSFASYTSTAQCPKASP